MNHTHKFSKTGEKVRAWRYLKTSPIPIWVVRNFHDIGDGKLTHRSGHVVTEGDWIVDLNTKKATVLTNEEFSQGFAVL